MSNTTIAAISTPPGVGGIGIVRLSGPDAARIAGRVFRPNGRRRISGAKGYTGMLGRIYGPDGDVDDAIAFVYHAPKTYTGEEVVELSCHGGIWAVRQTLRLCLDAGASPAGPGEFTKRAFLHGKLSLSQAEAVMDLVSATGATAMKAALAARDGALSNRVDAIADKLTSDAAHLAAWMDYPEEDLIPVDEDTLSASLAGALQDIEQLLSTWDSGRIIREGIPTAIVGRPNVGKSTLMNLLMGERRSIVTDLPGTTRDIVEGRIHLGDYTLLLADTAGIRDTDNPVESIGVELSKKQIETAELVLAVFDSSEALQKEDMQLLDLLRGKTCIAVINKTDRPTRLDDACVRSIIPVNIFVSATHGEGKDALEQAVADALGLAHLDPAAAMVSNERQRHCLEQARALLHEALHTLKSGFTLDAVGVSIDAVLDALLSLTGRRVSDTVVDEVFSRFCVGK